MKSEKKKEKIKNKETKKVKDKQNKKVKPKKAGKKNKVVIEQAPIQKEYFFGHNENDDIFDCFLTNKMFAHRGLWDKESPENSLRAFEKAINNGYAIELDVNPIEDGTPVVFHDSKMSRMTGKDRYIQNLSKEELENTTLLDTDQKIPTLEEVPYPVKMEPNLVVEFYSRQ